MKVSIVNPNLSGDVSILDIGITCLSTYINERTIHESSIIDFTFHRKKWKKHLAAELCSQDPDVLGISATSLYMPYCREIISEAKKNKDSLKIIMGGWHCAVDPDDSINNYPQVDAIIMGDGEYALEEYLDNLENSKPFSGIKGVWFRDNTGKIVRNTTRPLIEDLDSLPFPDYDQWKDIDKYLFYNQMLYVIGNRGCPFSCTYCSEALKREKIPGPHIRWRTPESFVEEIRYHYEKYKNRGMRIAHIFDPVFPNNKEWLFGFVTAYKKSGLSGELPFSCFTRADTIDEERIKMLASANCRILRTGIEAGNEGIRRGIYNKNISNDQYRRVFEMIHKEGIKITGYNMLGGPGETPETLKDTFDFVRELDVDRPIFFTYRPLHKTRSAEILLEKGGKVTGWDGIDSLHRRYNIVTDSLNPRKVGLFRYKCLFYFTLRRAFRLIKKQKAGFFINLIRFFIAGFRDGLDFEYIIGYFFVCAGDNLTE
ncbi:MAG: radical SAM protein [Elusimicrobiota bacterium]